MKSRLTMGEVMDHLMGDLRRLTACRTKCPECGHVGMAAWTREEGVCKCRACGLFEERGR